MSPRKRRDPPSPISPRRSPKRLRFPPTPWNHPEETATTSPGSSGPASKYSSSGPYYEIKGIRDESDTKYLVDWADDLITKQTYVPDWQPKKYVNAAAVKLWEIAKVKGTANAQLTDDHPIPPKTPLQPRNPRHSHPFISRPELRSNTVAPPAVKPNSIEPQKRILPLPASQQSVQSVATSLDISKFPDVAVQISSHSSLDKEAYLTYHSSLAEQASLASTAASTAHSASTSSWQPENSAVDQRSTRALSLAPVDTATSDETPIADQTSTDFQSASSIPSPTRVTGSENGATIPDSQPIPKSPAQITPLSNSTPQRPEVASEVDHIDSESQISAESVQLTSNTTGQPRERARLRGIKTWVVDDSSTQSPPVDPEDQLRFNEKQFKHPLQQSTEQSSVQVPGSEGALTSPVNDAHLTQERSVILQTQAVSEPELFVSVEEDLGTQTLTSPTRTLFHSVMDDKASSLSAATPAQRSSQDKEQESPRVSESLLERVERQRIEIRAATDAALAADREERRRSLNNTPIDTTPLHRAHFEVEARNHPIARIVRPSASPLLVRAALSPKGPPSPSTLRSPLEVRVSTPSVPQSPRSLRSPSHISEKPLKEPPLGQNYVGIEPSEMIKDMPALTTMAQHHKQPQPADGPTSSQPTGPLRTTALRISHLGPMEYIIPLSMPPRTQKQYIETYRFFQRRIEAFLRGARPDDRLRNDVTTLLDRVGKVTVHMDLDGGGPSSQDQFDAHQEALYAESCSEKFKFLGAFLEATRQDILHIAIFARGGQLLDFLETYLRAKKINYTRPDSAETGSFEDYVGQSHVSLLASRNDGSSPTFKTADLVIAFDETFDANDQRVKEVRVQESNISELSPVIRPIVYGSLEHINLCISPSIEPNERMRRLIYCMLVCEKVVGQLSPDNSESSAYGHIICADQVVAFIHNGSKPSDWEVSNMPPLENMPLMDPDTPSSEAMSDASGDNKQDGAARYWPNPDPPSVDASGPKIGEKRQHDLVYGDSIETQAKKFKDGRRSTDFHEKGEDLSPSVPLNPTVEGLTHANEALEAEVSKVKKLLKEYDQVFETRQARFESDRYTIGSLKSANEALRSQLAKKTAELEASKSELTISKTARNGLQTELDSLRQNLRTNPSLESSHSALITAERIRERLAAVESDSLLKDKKIKGLETDFNFTRAQYQTAGTAIVEAQSTIAAQEAELLILRRRANEVRVQLREARERDINGSLRKEVSRLRETIKMREKEIRDRETELRELRRGRAGVVTRGSSVQPGAGTGMRSPRGGSRGVSPAVMVGHSGGVVVGNGVQGPGGAGAGGTGGVPMARALSGLSSRFG